MSRLAEILPRMRLHEDLLAANLAAAQTRLTTMLTQIEQLKFYQSEFKLPETGPAIVCDAIIFSRRLSNSISEFEAKVPLMTEELENSQTAWQQAHSKRKALESLIHKQEREIARQKRRKEEKKAETLIALRYSSH
ncbi:hypothetical protein AB833_21835 [Chromatiales bacterium (ex Bugula neritina AB1)]|nr:hypothetical protein AB833_21835 [Chromatiales bacterium (ex Bugula neritina AB1)]